MKLRFPALSLVIPLALCLITARSAQAETPEPGASEKKRVLMISSDLEREAIVPFADAVRAQLSDLQVEFDVVWVSAEKLKKRSIKERAEILLAEENTAAVFWCDLNRADGPALYMSIPDLDRVLVRRLGGVGEGGMPETTGIIVRASVDAILRGLPNVVYTAWMDLAQLEEALATPPAVDNKQKGPTVEIRTGVITEPDKGKRLLIGAAYAIGFIASEQNPDHGIAAHLSLQLARGFYGYLGYTLFPIYQLTGMPVYYKTTRHVGSIGGRYSGDIGPIFDLGVSLGARFDLAVEEIQEIQELEQSDPDQGFSPKEAGRFAEISITPALNLGVEIAPRLRFFLLVGADILMLKWNFAYEDANGQEVPLVDTWTVRPTAQLGLTLGLF